MTLSSSKHQRAVTGLLSRAGVTPQIHDVKPLDKKLMVLTGAQEPSGVPYVPPVVAANRPKYAGKRRRYGR